MAETRRSERAAELHNRLAPEIVASIVKPVTKSGGTVEEILLVTESVLVGITLYCVRLGGDEKVLDAIVNGARARLAAIRLGSIEPEGSA